MGAKKREGKTNSSKSKSGKDKYKSSRHNKVKHEDAGEDGAKNTKYVCLSCKKKGRRYNHPPDKCNYAKGDKWHGLEGQALKDVKNAFFDELKRK